MPVINKTEGVKMKAKQRRKATVDNPTTGNNPDAIRQPSKVETGRGIIRDNHLAALVTSKVFKSQVVKAKKGKGTYQRKEKHKGRESYLMAA